MISCDEAFELLTSPVTTARRDLHEHLAGCPRCRDLQDALSPALNVLQQSGAVRASQTSASAEMASLLAARLAAGRRLPAPPSPRLKAAIYAALLVMLGGGVVLLCTAGGAAPPAAAGVTAPATGTSLCLWQTRNLTTFPAEARSGDVVLTCVACHTHPGASPLHRD